MQRLGGSVIGFASADATSVKKGESLTDTIRTIDQYADGIVIRHPRIGSAEEAAVAAVKPVINGGDGAGQHPTQALLDLYTIHAERGGLDDTSILLCGDLKYGRTIHAGVELYKHYETELILVSPEKLSLPSDIMDDLKRNGVNIKKTSVLEEALPQADVIYMTRIQKERFEDPEEYERYKDQYVLTRQMIEQLNPEITILHPLPRLNEIEQLVDDLNNAAYFRQVRNGVFMRMALLFSVLINQEHEA
jgi:aspartate carbamoyltransferase catalytic subunit